MGRIKLIQRFSQLVCVTERSMTAFILNLLNGDFPTMMWLSLPATNLSSARFFVEIDELLVHVIAALLRLSSHWKTCITRSCQLSHIFSFEKLVFKWHVWVSQSILCGYSVCGIDACDEAFIA